MMQTISDDFDHPVCSWPSSTASVRCCSLTNLAAVGCGYSQDPFRLVRIFEGKIMLESV